MNIPAGTYTVSETHLLGSAHNLTSLLPLSGNATITISPRNATRFDFLNTYPDYSGNNFCNKWDEVKLFETTPRGLSFLSDFSCNVAIAHQLEVGKTYLFRHKFYCAPATLPAVYSQPLGSPPIISGLVLMQNTGGYYDVILTPDPTDIGYHNMNFETQCGWESCSSCGLWFEVIESQGDHDGPPNGDPLTPEFRLGTTYNALLYPNPAGDFITLDFPDSHSNEMVRLAVKDVLGRQVFQSEFDRKTQRIDLSNWVSGSYLFTIQSGDQIETRTVIKK